ncbi:Quaternary ammonium compound-resistance protein SugE [bacterium HR17]|jgi:quaternary ammonium compound-resistance protein SugE|uniref:Quaternary ammonium compound-resistance protein SugE n=1 Tax=Candidatus Fervidibacter japonicus TaxID=2035412 RepID=A0A2H5XD49_9BACT|nr:Quaternary ammonium compound-resistance protein SugE [bacterium HR17]
MEWVYLLLAGMLEIVWAVALKLSNGFTRPMPAAVVIVAGLLSLFFLSLAARHIPIGTAYAVWTGIGAAGVATVGILYFNEPRDWLRLLFIALIIAGVVGLHLVELTGAKR